MGKQPRVNVFPSGGKDTRAHRDLVISRIAQAKHVEADDGDHS